VEKLRRDSYRSLPDYFIGIAAGVDQSRRSRFFMVTVIDDKINRLTEHLENTRYRFQRGFACPVYAC
jgi:hypothetical protein